MLGVVVIGRNEGERLGVCLRSILAAPQMLPTHVVYVDSGSSDGSVALAASLGVGVVSLDMALPFTAARARNLGFEQLQRQVPGLRYVQFVDGDCELVSGWLPQAVNFLEAHAQVVVVCGRRRERFPERSIFNQLCDQEWDTPVGEAKSCGGDALMRVSALQAVGGYRNDLIAGEEPELCVRLRQAGGRVWRLPLEMTLHDAAMLHWSQWWKRGVRAGYAFAQGAALHGAAPEHHWVRESRRAWFWGLGLPCFVLVSSWWSPWGAVLWLLYPLQVARLSRLGAGSLKARLTRALFLVLGKFAEAVGQLRFLALRWAGRQARLIEYK